MASCTAITRAGKRCRNRTIDEDNDRCRVHRRVIVLDDRAVAQLLAFLRAGNYLEVAAAAAGLALDDLPDELREQADVARASGEALAIARINQAATESWQAAAWLLERQYPERWARPATRVGEERAGELGPATDQLDELARQRSARRAGRPR